MVLPTLLMISCKGKKEENGNQQKRPTPMVDVGVVAYTDFKHINNFSGSLLSNEEIELRSETSGRVVKINFKEGALVTKDQLLVKINDAELSAQLKKNQIQTDLAADDETRKRELLKISGISREEYETSLNRLKTLQAEKEVIMAQIEKTEMRAPFNGIIGLRTISEGAYLSPTTLITTLQQINPIKLEFSIPEKFKYNLSNNQEVTFTIEGNTKEYTARIYALEPKIDASTRTIKVRATSSNSDGKLIPGAFASVKISFTSEGKTILIPSKAIVPINDGEQVYIVQNGMANSIKVKTGVRTGSEVEIIEGLNIGDTIVLSGLLQMKSGMPVKTRLSQKRETAQ